MWEALEITFTDFNGLLFLGILLTTITFIGFDYFKIFIENLF